MAERGAHITASLQPRPSIFEVVAQDSLTTTLHPAVRRLTVFLATCNPDRYGWLIKWFDEAYLVVNSVMQYYFLKNHASSFAENFYGLQRTPLRQTPCGTRLPLKEEVLSLICLTILPYMHSKFESLAIRFRLEEVDGVTSEKWSEASRQLIMKAHALFHLTWEGIILTQYLSYMSGKTEAHSPILQLARVTLKYDEQREENHMTDFWRQYVHGDLSLIQFSTKFVGNIFTRSLEFGAFFLQFLQWWNVERSSTSLTALPVPEPKKVHIEGSQMYGSLCPICLNVRKIETALPVSGYVFCYRCIVGHLKKNNYCPITKFPASVEDLIRIYSSES